MKIKMTLLIMNIIDYPNENALLYRFQIKLKGRIFDITKIFFNFEILHLKYLSSIY